MIQIHDKKFEPYISKVKIKEAITQLADEINHSYANKNVVLLSVLNGSFMFCSDLAKKLTCQPEIHFIKLQSYVGTHSSGEVKTKLPLSIPLKDREVLVVEDIVDTGKTLEKLQAILEEEHVKSYEIATLLFKPEAFLGKNKPKFVGLEIPNNFVVGYGLDYNNLGREIPEILKIVE